MSDRDLQHKSIVIEVILTLTLLIFAFEQMLSQSGVHFPIHPIEDPHILIFTFLYGGATILTLYLARENILKVIGCRGLLTIFGLTSLFVYLIHRFTGKNLLSLVIQPAPKFTDIFLALAVTSLILAHLGFDSKKLITLSACQDR